MGLIQYYHITCKPVNRAICIFITVPIVYFVILFQQNVLLYYCIYADDVQLLFSGSPNNLEQLKIYAETSLNTMKE